MIIVNYLTGYFFCVILINYNITIDQRRDYGI